jgi:hypothetical protein
MGYDAAASRGHEPFLAASRRYRFGAIHNLDSSSTEVHNLGRKLRRFFNGLRPLNPTRRAYVPEQTGVLIRGDGRAIPTKRAAGRGQPIPGKRAELEKAQRAARRCRLRPRSEETGVRSGHIPSRPASLVGLQWGRQA